MSKQRMRPSIDRLRGEAEREATARSLGLPKGAGWRDIAATEHAEAEAQQFAEDSAWFHEMDLRDLDQELCDGLGCYSSPMSRANQSSYPDDDIGYDPGDPIVPDYDPFEYRWCDPW